MMQARGCIIACRHCVIGRDPVKFAKISINYLEKTLWSTIAAGLAIEILRAFSLLWWFLWFW